MKNIQKKFNIVITKNTFYFHNREFEESYEGYVNSIKETLLVLKNQIQNKGLKKELFEDLIRKKENGLRALLALTGFSNESLKRLMTFIRIVDDPELNTLIYKERWIAEAEIDNKENIKEWSDDKIQRKIRESEFFRKGMVNIFFEGSTIPVLSNVLPLFELKKLSISKLNFEIEALIDTLIRYKEKGSYSGKKENNPEVVIENILDEMKIGFEKGDLGELIKNAPDTKRTMDFIVPNKKDPKIIIECSYLVTTSSGQGDKSKTEISIDSLIKEHYSKAHFLGFVDGIGWYVRKNDLKRMVAAYEDVFTFHQQELERFKQLIKEVLV
ncbi:MAG: DpnII family type II restriction endonuclease [bacterium]|nr:DpnII family type II restriction endonuclease [bacterium]